jgi:hypothetical protein
MTKKDPLAGVAERVEKASCKHPHLVFTRNGFQLKCVDCDRRYIAAFNNDSVEYDIGDFSYIQPSIVDGSPRHSPDEAPRTEKKPKTPEKIKKIR